ncbi:MAG: ribonuclease P protein component [Ornithinimicrobium sp.]|uniref:ribonuclease P protein component n=1 Tax=Ornithinimicrobium sp. TaxID=1977084 RepID=UPI003D9BC507
MLPRRHRLTRPEEFRTVLRGGPGVRSRRAGGRAVVVHRADRNPSSDESPGPPRVGLLVSKAVGNSVVRHRVSRRLRALMATRLDSLPQGTDVVLRATPAAASVDHPGLADDLDRALARASR